MWKLMALCLLLGGFVAAGSGCGRADNVRIEWDLSQSHNLDDVQWPPERRNVSTFAHESVESALITFPGQRVLRAERDVGRVMLTRNGDVVQHVQVVFKPQTLQEALARAKGLAAEWSLPTEPLQTWYEQQMAEHGGRDVTKPALTIGQRAGAPDDFTPEVQIRYSFNKQRPAVVYLTVLWWKP